MVGNMNLFKKTITRFSKLPVLVRLVFITGFISLLYSGQKLIFSRTSSVAPKYQTATAETGTLISSVSASGQVLTVNIMSANTLASGTVKKMYVKDGDTVKKGDKLLEIDLDFQGSQKNAAAWASYLSAKNSLETAKTALWTLQGEMYGRWEDFRDLAENSTYTNGDGSPDAQSRTLPEFIISNNNWLASEAKYKQQQSVIAQSQAALSSSWMSYSLTSPVITAPTDGIVTSLMYTEGMTIGSLDTGNSSSNEKVATIKTEGMPVISVNLSEIDVSKVKVGQKVTVMVDSIPDKTFTGSVVGVDRIGSTTSGVTQYPAIIKLDTAPEDLLPGMAVTANILVDKKDNALLVPVSAVTTEDGQPYVRVMSGIREQSVPVVVGLSSDTQTEIISGLSEGDQVITGSSSSENNAVSPFSSNRGVNFMRMGR